MIEISDAAKEYGGRLARGRGRGVLALDGVSLHLPPGAAVGIAGPNGAGKSTLLRLLLGYIRPTRGQVRVGGMPPRDFVERHGIAYVSEVISIPPGWTVRHALNTFAALSEVPDSGSRITEVMERLGISGHGERRVDALSKGNLQRLALAQALLAPRQVMILDEPTHGLDPEWTARLRDLVAEWRAQDPARVLIVASHNLEEMEKTVDSVAVLREGKLCAMLDARAPASLRLEAEGEPGWVAAAFPAARPLAGSPGAYRMAPLDSAGLSQGLTRLLAAGGRVRAVHEETERLEDRVRDALLAAGSAS